MRLAPRSALALVLALLGCQPLYRASGHYESPKPPATATTPTGLLSAHLSSYGEPEGFDDVLVLVFAQELDPLGLVPEAFGIVRADGRRVRPVEARLAADEGDENRSVILRGAFGSHGHDPLAIHVIGELFSERGDSFEGLDIAITPHDAPDRVVLVEALAVDAQRCPGAQQVVRLHFSDLLAGVGEHDLAAIEVSLADGSKRVPIAFDDQARREGEAALLGPSDDNVLDVCIDVAGPLRRMQVGAGVFTDVEGHATAAIETSLGAG